MKVNNITRKHARYWDSPVDPDKDIWISIEEPGLEESVVRDSPLEKLPHLRIAFWDIVKITQGFGLGEYFYPPTEDDAKQIVDFILAHPGKNVVVNCKAGVSRSSAISRFCSEYLGYEWDAEGFARAVPNQLLYDMMVKYHNKPKKTVINDKRRK